MKIQAINNNTFKGLFTDKSKQNNNEWLMEYRPYSWELDKYTSRPKMELKEHVDIKANKLPDNEEIYTKAYGSEPERSKDILGTESYYKYPSYIMNGKMRSTITVKEPLNREDSLKVYLEKMNKFRTKKEQEQKILGNLSNYDIDKNYKTFREYSNAYEEAFFSHRDEKNGMDNSAKRLHESANKLFKQATAYVNMTESLKETDKTINEIKIELDTIDKAKKEGKVIDISIRSGEDPDAPLKNYVANKTYDDVLNENFLLILPAIAIRFKDMIGKLSNNGAFYKNNQKAFADNLVQYAKSHIKNAIK